MSFSGWLKKLQRDLHHTQQSAFAQGTLKNFQSQWNKFVLFSKSCGRSHLPVSTETLCLYMQFLSRSLKSTQSISNYVSGLKSLHQMLDLPFPSTADIQFRLTLKGLKKLTAHVSHQATPITPHILKRIYEVLDVGDPVHMVFWGLFLFMFFLFARKSQFIPSALSMCELSKLVRRCDIVPSNDGLIVVFRWTKTRQCGGKPLLIPLLPVPGSCLCPVKAYADMVQAVPASSKAPAFMLPTSNSLTPVLYSLFHKVLRRILTVIGEDAAQFSSHSFRRGGATFAFSLGVRGELIQSQGDWASEAYKLYIQLDYDQRVSVARSMVDFLH